MAVPDIRPGRPWDFPTISKRRFTNKGRYETTEVKRIDDEDDDDDA